MSLCLEFYVYLPSIAGKSSNRYQHTGYSKPELTLGPYARHFSYNRFTGISRRNGTRKLFRLERQDDAVLNSIERLNTGLFAKLLCVVCVALLPSPTPLGAYAKKRRGQQ